MADFDNFVKELNTMIQSSSSSSSTSSSSNTSSLVDVSSVKEVNNEVVKRKLKLLFVSTHVNQGNGYSKVAYQMLTELAQYSWLQVTHFGTQKIPGGDLNRKYPENMKVIDGTALEKDKQLGFAFNELASIIIPSEKPDIVFIYNDLAVTCSYIEQIRKLHENRKFKIWTYLDLTYQCISQQLLDVINRDVERIFCFTKGWKEVLKSHSITRPVDVMNHAVSPKLLRQIPREMARQTLGLPKEVFLFTSINKNIPRKRLDLLIIAFVKLIIRFPTKSLFMLLVADKGDTGGYQLFDIFAREIKLNGGSVEMFGNRLLVTSKDSCYRDEDINLLYNSGDVGVSCAEGEGFGLCTFEQMYLGVPQIVPNILGYNEYCTSENSTLVEPKLRYYIPKAYNPVTGEAQMVDPEDISKAMEAYVFDENLRKAHGKAGKEKVSEYTWTKSMATFVKRLKTQYEVDEDED
jgi:glycosyltransferase involved in cell wall biosynthesis